MPFNFIILFMQISNPTAVLRIKIMKVHQHIGRYKDEYNFKTQKNKQVTSAQMIKVMHVKQKKNTHNCKPLFYSVVFHVTD